MALLQSRRSLSLASALLAAAAAQSEPQRQTFAPHEMSYGDAPPPIVWSTPPLPNRTIKLETAEERHVRLVIVNDELEQPWSMAFLPDGGMLVTERAGRVRLIRNGKLESKPVRGVPHVYTGGPRGLQGLMDIALHPDFRENGWVYLTYDKPSGNGGSTALARGTWNGVELVGVQELFDSEARDTEASRLAFGRDRMLYMTISAPGSPDVKRSQAPTPLSVAISTSRRFSHLAIATDTRSPLTPKPVSCGRQSRAPVVATSSMYCGRGAITGGRL